MGSNNFLDNDEYSSDIDEVVEEFIEEYEEDSDEIEQTSIVVNEAMKRIEQANLYKALLDHQLFSPGSARPEIISIVRKEFKAFILSRLNILLGLKPDPSYEAKAVPYQSPFDETETEALKAIAKKLTTKSPTVTTVDVRTPKIQSLETQTSPMIQSVPTIAPAQTQATETRRVVRRVVRKPAQQAPEPQTEVQRKPRKKSGNVSEITGQDLSQAVNPAKPPMKMPSQSEIDMINARQADLNSRGAGNSIPQGGSVLNQILKNNR